MGEQKIDAYCRRLTIRSDTCKVTERYLCYAVVSASFVFLVAMMCLYSLDFPYLDQWEFVSSIGKSFDGGVTLGDLWGQHNEHRLIFPKALMLVMAHMSGWDVRWELATNVILGSSLFAVLAAQIMATARRNRLRRAHLVLAWVSLMVFSLNQWENWFLGWQLQEFMNVLAAVSGMFVLSRRPCGKSAFAVAIFLGVIATYSFANGMAYWVIGAMVIALSSGRRSKELPAWVAVSVIVIASYLYDYHSPEYHPSIGYLVFHPLDYGGYVLKYLGAAMVDFSETGALLAGCLCLACFAKATHAVLESESPSESPFIPYLAIGLYGLASAMITGVGRVGFGGSQALAPRYIAFSNLVWIADAAMVWMWLHKSNISRVPYQRKVVVGCVLFSMGLIGFGCLYGAYRWTERYHFRIEARTELLDGDNLDMLRRIFPIPEKIVGVRPILREKHLSIFR